MALGRRVRGMLLRLVRHRGRSALFGILLVVPSVWVEFIARGLPAWSEGVALVCGGVGIALIWTAVTGVSPDWTDPDG